jgi:hypothetical protein
MANLDAEEARPGGVALSEVAVAESNLLNQPALTCVGGFLRFGLAPAAMASLWLGFAYGYAPKERGSVDLTGFVWALGLVFVFSSVAVPQV